ncbi:MAG: ATP-dependent helicase, partial [Gemmatimonadaceae bacterium]
MAEPPRIHVPLPARRHVPPPPAAATGPALNAAQADAASHGDTPLLIVAGAGTGKTRTLIHRVAALIGRGVPPSRILLLTFTRRAAQEMIGRCERLVGSASQQVQGGTFHGVAHRLLRRFGPAAGLPADFTILDQSDAGDLMGLSRSALGYGDLKHAPRGAPRFPRAETLLAVYSRHVNTDQPVADLLGDQWPHFLSWAGDLERCFTDYVRRKGERNLLDYDDLLLSWALLLEQAPPIAEQIRAHYDHVLVDEYQDTNGTQYKIIKTLAQDHRNLCVVGDDDQSIYGWRGAEVRHILNFKNDWPEAKVVRLEENYRSTDAILTRANRLIAFNQHRHGKILRPARRNGAPPRVLQFPGENE